MDYEVFNYYRKDPSELGAVYAYHVTPTANVESIKADGITARSCVATRDGDARRPAVYLLANRNDAYDSNIRSFLFDAHDLAVIRVRIPSNEFDNLHVDGIFNMSCQCSDGSYPSGIQYTGSIPASWIEVI